MLNAHSNILHIEVFTVCLLEAFGLGFGVVFLYDRVDSVTVDIIALGNEIFEVRLLQIAQCHLDTRAEAISHTPLN